MKYFSLSRTFESCKQYLISTWNSKEPVLYGCFNWMIQNLYMGNGCLTKHPLKTGCLEFQVYIIHLIYQMPSFAIVFLSTYMMDEAWNHHHPTPRVACDDSKAFRFFLVGGKPVNRILTKSYKINTIHVKLTWLKISTALKTSMLSLPKKIRNRLQGWLYL